MARGVAHEIWGEDIPEGVVVKTFGLPLTDITDSTTLDAKVVRPLLDELSRG